MSKSPEQVLELLLLSEGERLKSALKIDLELNYPDFIEIYLIFTILLRKNNNFLAIIKVRTRIGYIEYVNLHRIF